MPRISFFGLKAAGSNVMGSISQCEAEFNATQERFRYKLCYNLRAGKVSRFWVFIVTSFLVSPYYKLMFSRFWWKWIGTMETIMLLLCLTQKLTLAERHDDDMPWNDVEWFCCSSYSRATWHFKCYQHWTVRGCGLKESGIKMIDLMITPCYHKLLLDSIDFKRLWLSSTWMMYSSILVPSNSLPPSLRLSDRSACILATLTQMDNGWFIWHISSHRAVTAWILNSSLHSIFLVNLIN